MKRQKETLSFSKTGAGQPGRSRLLFRVAARTGIALTLFAAIGCAIVATRPVQEMSNTAAAIRAAREIQADTLSPDLFRQANEWFFKAKHEYKFKNFREANEYARKARLFAEQAEFESLKTPGATRIEQTMADPFPNEVETAAGKAVEPSAPVAQLPPSEYATPTGVPVETLEAQENARIQAEAAAEAAAKNAVPAPSASFSPGAAPPNPLSNIPAPTP